MIEHALSLLKQGELVAIPTETVYGLAGDAANPDAVRKIFTLKGRPANHPVIVHIYGQAQLADWAQDIPDIAYQLADAFWPGPLTLILKKHNRVSDLLSGGQDSIGLRAPNHPLTQQLLQHFGGGLAAPSANRFGHVSPTTAQHVQMEFGERSPLIIDGGPSHVGLESTIISLLSDTPILLRPGSISPAQIGAVLQRPITIQSPKTSPINVRAPGLLDSHYAPHTPLILGTLPELIAKVAKHPDEKVVFIHYSVLPIALSTTLPCLSMPFDNATAYAQALYATLRHADHCAAKWIGLEKPPHDSAWLAINDRLRRAASIWI